MGKNCFGKTYLQNRELANGLVFTAADSVLIVKDFKRAVLIMARDNVSDCLGVAQFEKPSFDSVKRHIFGIFEFFGGGELPHEFGLDFGSDVAVVDKANHNKKKGIKKYGRKKGDNKNDDAFRAVFVFNEGPGGSVDVFDWAKGF